MASTIDNRGHLELETALQILGTHGYRVHDTASINIGGLSGTPER